MTSTKINGETKSKACLEKDKQGVKLELEFQGHYNENKVKIALQKKFLKDYCNKVRFKLIGDPVYEGKNEFMWESVDVYIINQQWKDIQQIGEAEFSMVT